MQSDVDYWFVDLDNDGEVKQEWSYGYGSRNILSSAFVNQDGDLLLGGTSVQGNTTESKSFFLGSLLDREGNVKWEDSFSGTGDNVLSKLIQARDGGYIFAGTSDSKKDRTKSQIKGLNDFWIIKVRPDSSQLSSQESNSLEEKEKPKIEAIPNPVSTFTNIIIPLDYQSGILNFYDSSGRLLFQKTIKYQTEPLDLGRYPAGTYIVSIKTNTMQGSVNVLKE